MFGVTILKNCAPLTTAW